MRKYRIVEDSRLICKDGAYVCEHVFHVEEREWFLFFYGWDRIFSSISSEKEAREILSALEERDRFKPKILNPTKP